MLSLVRRLEVHVESDEGKFFCRAGNCTRFFVELLSTEEHGRKLCLNDALVREKNAELTMFNGRRKLACLFFLETTPRKNESDDNDNGKQPINDAKCNCAFSLNLIQQR